MMNMTSGNSKKRIWNFSGWKDEIGSDSQKNEAPDMRMRDPPALTFKHNSKSRKKNWIPMMRVHPDLSLIVKEDTEEIQFFMEKKFNATLKGIVDVQGRISEPFTLLVALCPRIPANDKDYTKYPCYLALHVDYEKAWFSMQKEGKLENLTEVTDVVMTDTHMGLDPDTITTYWLSYDRDNMTIKYGKGYAMEETTLLICNFSEGITDSDKMARRRKQWSSFFGIYDQNRYEMCKDKEATILLYRTPRDIARQEERVVIEGEVPGFVHMEPLIKVRKQPLIANPSPFVLDAAKATLNIIDKGIYTFSSELPPACKVLYETMEKCELDMEYELGVSDIRLSDAVRNSINTEGALLNALLKTKNYLRITMGKSMGESPGIPYVLEFWPPGARSPIHNHGSVCGLIKILFGTIQSGIFNKVPSTVTDSDNKFRPTELFKFDASKGDVLWMSPEWYQSLENINNKKCLCFRYQTHQLRNVSTDFCATVNCYKYDENDSIQWNLFDYVNDENGEVGNFFPNTDLTFGEMRKIVFDEWNLRIGRNSRHGPQ